MQDCLNKIYSLASLNGRSASRTFKRPPGRVAFTNGCFDIIHAGHLSLLLHARSMADGVIVGLNSDASIARLKGPERPVFPQGERAMLLAALSCVDRVVIFDDDTPEAVVRELRPDIMIKGEDWRDRKIAGAEYAGKVVFAPFLAGRSTTAAINAYIEARRRASTTMTEGQSWPILSSR